MNQGPYESLITWFARNSVAANLLMFILLGGGLWSAVNMQKEVFPRFQLDVVEVEVTYPGAAPSEVEQGTGLALALALADGLFVAGATGGGIGHDVTTLPGAPPPAPEMSR